MLDPDFDLSAILRLCCSHENSTPADGTGRAICTKCGSVFQKHVSLTLLQKTFDQILYGVSFEDAWGNRIDPRDVHAGPTG